MDLSGYLDNTDAQAISVASDIISITGSAGTIDLTPYLDNTDTQDLSLVTDTLSLVNGGSVDLSGYLDNTDAQTLSIDGSNNLIIAGGNQVCLSAYLDNTDTQNLFLTIVTPRGTSPVANSSNDTLTFLNGTGITITGCRPDQITIAATLGTSIDTTEIDNATILFADFASNSCGANQDIEYNGSAWICGAAENEYSFGTISTPTGTIVTDAVNDTLTFTDGNGVVITGTAGTDTVDVSLDVTTTGTTSTIASNSGLETDASGLRLLGGCADGQILKWDATGSEWECGDLLAAGNNARQVYKTADESLANSNTLQNDDDLYFDVGANEDWIYFIYINPDGPANADIFYDISVPTGTTCETTAASIAGGGITYGNLGCATATGNMPLSNDVNSEHLLFGTITKWLHFRNN